MSSCGKDATTDANNCPRGDLSKVFSLRGLLRDMRMCRLFLSCKSLGNRILCPADLSQVLTPLLPPHTTLYSLHGHLPPSARTKTLSNFTKSVALPSSPSILLATDVAARGLDLPDVDVVIQFDPPTDTKSFSHRCGRTARAGRSGRAWTLLVGREVGYVEFMAVRKIPLKERPKLCRDDSVMPDGGTTVDTEVVSVMTTIRQKVLTDRALHDKVSCTHVFPSVC